ncbi:MAG: iron ABC transporter permease, partial [Bacteroidaceae bacterium]|nr:iron ABC transporter permease [Bacteroidaceae bacterium]
MKKGIIFCVWMGCLMVFLFAINLLVGAVDIPTKEVVNILMVNDSGHPSWQYIVLQSRLPQAITAMLC